MNPSTVSRRTCLAADIGGTFTDLVLDAGGRRFARKVLTTPAAPQHGLIDGMREILAEAGLSFRDIDVFVHGTTLATNAILERRGARTALIATEGFRDVLEIGTEGRFDQYDLTIEKAVPLVPRELRFVVPERIDAHGNVLRPLDARALERVVAEIRRLEIESVAVALLHSYVDPAHEEQVAAAVRKALPAVPVSLSSQVCPEIREYERTSTTVANAYVQPQIDRYLGAMADDLAARGFRGVLYLVTSSGALTTLDSARRYPVRLVESGPAGGAIYAAREAQQRRADRVLSFDMGGTTAKICLVRDGAPTKGRTFEVDRTRRFRKGSGLPVRIPVTEMVEIGAGGGSIAAIDVLGRATNGPHSAGSEPGPACYGRGGTRPTVTDAGLVLGLLDPADFAGGKMRLDPDGARRALLDVLAAAVSPDPERAAHAVHELVCENMAAAARVHAVEQGLSLADFTMIAFGGAAPLHAARVAEKVGVRRLVVPPDAGVGSAVGFLAAPIAFEVIRTLHTPLSVFDADRVNRLLSALEEEAKAVVLPAAGGAQVIQQRSAHMRYVGQGSELEIAMPLRPLTAEDAGWLRAEFEREYTRQFGRPIPDAAVEVLNWSILLSTPAAAPPPAAGSPPSHPAAHAGIRTIFDGRRRVEVPVFQRARLRSGASFSGPAIVTEAETSTYVTAQFDAHIDGRGCIVLDRKPEPTTEPSA